MAIQNFLSGGYYGKLGATVGQRWKNKRTIRTYVVPANPRTPTQQANRNKFANAVTFAQMGMQMNYYCTLFEDENFTKWNYRMKVARELKNAGLTELDLIPLYPINFNPPTLITEITKDKVQGQKHITFAVPDLILDVDRVLSLMFAIYDEQNQFLGYKLYLGYYYATNKGYIEVDVDDVAEINTHCFVRIISNDDENSTTDLIGSPRITVGGSTMDIHTFNKTIQSVQKETTGLTITFAEPWKGEPTINTISFDLNCVINGKIETLNATSLSLFNNNGYCAVTLPYTSATSQFLPALPSGSGLSNLTVDYEGATWQITIENAEESYSDSDLTRTITNSITWDPASTTDIAFSVEFGGTVETNNKYIPMVCSGRFDDRSQSSQQFSCVGDGSVLTFTCTGTLKNYPMSTEGDKISLPRMQFTCNGVNYVLESQEINLRNAITHSYWLRDVTLPKHYYRDGGSNVGDPLISLTMQIEGVVMDTDPVYESVWIARIKTVSGKYLMPLSCQMERDTSDPTNMVLNIFANFDGAEGYDDVDTTCMITTASMGNQFDYKGVRYYFPIWPVTVGSWEL